MGILFILSLVIIYNPILNSVSKNLLRAGKLYNRLIDYPNQGAIKSRNKKLGEIILSLIIKEVIIFFKVIAIFILLFLTYYFFVKTK